jgi:thiamine biosynthesis protein ThiI
LGYSLDLPWRPPPDVGLNLGAGTIFIQPGAYGVSVTPPEGPHHDVILLRYGELALKSRKVRARFTAKLKDFIIDAFHAYDLDCVIEDDGGHLFIYSSDLPAATQRLARVFGVVSVSPAARVELVSMDDLAQEVAAYSKHVLEPGSSFAIRARRTGNHKFTSMELAKEAGSAVWKAFSGDLTVNLSDPDGQVEVEVRGPVAYIYHQRVPGVGGLPPGSQGKVLVPVRERSDVVAGWLLMRRGCAAVPLVPEGNEAADGLAVALLQWDPLLQVRTLPEADWDWPAFYQEMGRSRSMAVVSGVRGPEVPDLPLDRNRDPVVFFPLVGLDDEAYARLEKQVMG